jgi:hypothetical protein
MLGNINNGEAMKTKSIISLGLLAVFILSGCAVQVRPSLRIAKYMKASDIVKFSEAFMYLALNFLTL